MLANNWCARGAITSGSSAGLRSGFGRRKDRSPTRRLGIAAELGFRWFASDEGVLGRTLNIGFGRDADGVPSNADRLYAPLRVRLDGREITGFFRDHYLSDLVGFVYSRMDASAAAEDLHRRLRAIGERVQTGRPLTVSLILDGENAWEYYPGNGREFLRQFYRRIGDDPDIRALTVSEAIEAAGEIATADQYLSRLLDQRQFRRLDWPLRRTSPPGICCATRATSTSARWRSEGAAARDTRSSSSPLAFDALLAAEGSDWCWWFGPEHSSANDAEFDAFYRKLLSEVYHSLGAEAPDELAEPIKHQPQRAEVHAALGSSECARGRSRDQLFRVDGRRASTCRKTSRVPCTAGLARSDRFTMASATITSSCVWMFSTESSPACATRNSG